MKYKTFSGNGRTVHMPICYRCQELLEHIGSRAQKYCQSCKKIVDREKAAIRMQKHRQKAKQEGV